MGSCCTPDGSCSTDAAAAAATTTTTGGHETVYAVSGMTCDHCRSTLTTVIGELDDVLSVAVDVESGRIAVTTREEPDDALFGKVVDEAGYALTGRA